jgi:acetyl esterase/lipase
MEMPTHHAYGRDPAQFGELSVPEGERRPGTVVVLHGGFWRSAYDLSLGRPLAADLAARGWTAWNLEYRRLGNGGGWPSTFEDVAAGIDHLAVLGASSGLDTSRVAVVGHSAGGHLAVWAAGRGRLPAGAPGASPRIRPAAAVSQAGVLDLASAHRAGLSSDAVSALLGGGPEQVPERYAVADPLERVPLDGAVLCLHSRGDTNVPFGQSTAYVAAATAAGGRATLIETAGDHFSLIDPASPDWVAVVEALPALLGG